MKKIGLAALLMMLGSAYTFAIDGQVLINQSTVMAAGGFPYKITQPGSYKLSGNLVVPAGVDGIDITVDNATLDLNGFSVTGTGNGCTVSDCAHRSFGVSYTGSDTVRNGSVSGFFVGIAGSGRGIVEEIQATANFAGISANNSLVRRNNASGNLAEGFEGVDSSFVDNIANNNKNGDGFFTINSSLLQNTANHNFSGFEVNGGLFGSNTALGNLGSVSLSGALSQNNNNCDGSTC